MCRHSLRTKLLYKELNGNICVSVQRYSNHLNGVSGFAVTKTYQAINPYSPVVCWWIIHDPGPEHPAHLVLLSA